MGTLVSLVLCTFALYLAFLQVAEYNDLVNTKYRFKFFALRDRLNMLVATRKIDEKSFEYEETIKSINFHISATERVSFLWLVDMMVTFHTSKEEERRVECLSVAIGNDELRDILVEFMSTSHELLKRNCRAQLAVIKIAHRALKAFSTKPTVAEKQRDRRSAPAAPLSASVKRGLRAAKNAIVDPSPALHAIEAHRRTLAAAA